MKEELTAGKSVHASLKSGFQKAMSAIVDGSITTLIAAGVLWRKRYCKGFAQTLALGIVVSMFTALVITRLIIFSFYGAGIRNEKVYGRHLKERKPVDFLWKEKDFLHCFHYPLPGRTGHDGREPCKRNRRNELQP